MALSINTKAYTADSYAINSVGYAGPANTMSIKDYVKLYRQAPVAVANFSGVARTEAKLTRTLALTGAATTSHDGIMRVLTSIPVGASATDIDAFCADMGSWIASTAFKDLLKKQLINQ